MYLLKHLVIFTNQIIWFFKIGISRLGNGDGSDFSLEIYSNHKAIALFQADWNRSIHCQVEMNCFRLIIRLLVLIIVLFRSDIAPSLGRCRRMRFLTHSTTAR